MTATDEGKSCTATDVKFPPSTRRGWQPRRPELESEPTILLSSTSSVANGLNPKQPLLSSSDSSPLSSAPSSPIFPTFENVFARPERDHVIAKDRSNPTNPDQPTEASIHDRADSAHGEKVKRRSKSVVLGDVPKRRPKLPTASTYFSKSPEKKQKIARESISCIPFPPLTSKSFGLVQERLSHDPFRLLIAVIFLNKTRGSVAMPVFYELMERYPTPKDLAVANQQDVTHVIQHLGLQNQRAATCINLAKAWLERPPEKGKRYRVLHYPRKDDGKDIKPGETIDEEDVRTAWEVGQLPGVGTYAIDSWRIFCRDELRGLPFGHPEELTAQTEEIELQKEWTRVLPTDKELRAYLRWRWLRLGWEWDPLTGDRKKADRDEVAKAGEGGVMYEGNDGGMVMGGRKEVEMVSMKAEPKAEEKEP